MFANLHAGKKSCSSLFRTIRTIITITLIAFPFAVGFGQAVSFSTTRGFFDAPFQLALTAGAGETIRYTTDGSAPSATNGNVYTAPISITTTAVIRAISVSATGVSSVVTHSYFFPADIVRQPATIPGWPNNNYEIVGGLTGNTKPHDYEMDPDIVNNPAYTASLINGLKEIPTLSIVMNKADFWAMNDGSAAEYQTSAEIIYPNNPSANEQFNCGIEGHSHIRLKRSLRLVISNTYFPNGLVSNMFKNGPLNGNYAKTNFVRGKIILRAGNDRSWASPVYTNRTAYTRDEWYRQSQIDISGDGSPGTFMHLYINGIYWGLYNPVQRPDAGYSAQYYGGTYADWMSVEPDGIRSGDPTRFNYLVGPLTDKDMSVASNYNELLQYLDAANFSDYLALTWYSGMSDWPLNNFQGGNRNNPVTTHKYYGWDAEFSWDDDSYGYDVNNGAWVHPDFRSNKTASGDMTKIWHAARRNSDFMMLFADRVYKHCFNNGKLTDDASRQRWQTLNNFIQNAIIAESAKWGDAIVDGITRTKNDHWLPEVSRVSALMDGNAARFIAALRQEGYYPTNDPPVFSREGGITPAGATLTITNPNNNGTIYYTTDGSDPRASGGGVSPSALAYAGSPITLSGNISVKARVLAGNTWSALREAAYFVPTLKINEFMASNNSTINDEFGVPEDWIEIYNSGSQPVNIGGMYITDNLTNPTLYRIPDNNPSATTIPPNGYLLLWADNEPAQGPLHVNLKLSASGEAIGLYYMENGTPVQLDAYTFTAQSTDVSMGRYPDGASEFISFTSPTPGVSNLLSRTNGLFVNEIVASNTSGITDETGALADWIEIYNKNAKAVNIGGMYISNDAGNPLLFQIPNTNPAATTIPANGFIRLWADNQPAKGILHLGFELNQAAGTITLTERTGSENNVIDNFSYAAQTDNVAYGRYPDGSINTKFFSQPTPAGANTLPLVTGLYINEFLASNGTGKTDENGEFDDWFEIYNSTDQPIDIGGLFVTDNSTNPAKWQIPTNNPAATTIPAGGFLLLWADEQTAQGPLHTNIKLSASGEQIGLYQINGTTATVIDLIAFGPQTTDVSNGRLPDGAPVISVLARPTPGLSNSSIPVNKVPVANAGVDFSITLPVNTATLNGSGSDEDGTIATYSWTQVSGPNTAVFSSQSVAAPVLTGLVQGSYVFSLTVTDNEGARSAIDEVTLTVAPPIDFLIGGYSFETGFDGWTPASTGNNTNSKHIINPLYAFEGSGSILVQSKGNSAFVTSPQLNLAGYASATVRFYFRAESMESNEDFWLQYSSNNGSSWTRVATFVAGTGFNNGTFYQATVTMNSGTFNTTGRFRFRNDAGDATDKVYIDSVTISAKLVANGSATTVVLSPVSKTNTPPIANAGGDKVITLPTNSTTLSGSGTDAEGTIIGYAWSQVNGPNTAVFSNQTTASPTVSGLVEGTYVFSLVVTDNQNATSAADQVTVTVNPDLTGPSVSSTTPSANAVGVAANSQVTAVFTEALNPASISSVNAFVQSGPISIPVSVNYTAGSQSLVLIPVSPLSLSTQYTVTLKGGTGGISDMYGNVMVSDYTWSFTTASPDQVAPLSVISSPLNGATLTVNQAVSITGTASDASGINRVEVSVDGGSSWQVATGTTSWTFNWTPTTAGSVTIKSRGVDNAGNIEVAGTAPAANAITVAVTNVVSNPCPCTIFTTQRPAITNQRDNTVGIVVGTRFQTSVNGYVTAIRFFKGQGNKGTHIGQLWTSDGTLLSQATFTNETNSGWQTVTLPTPVAITAGVQYIVSYYSSQGYYSVTGNFFANSVVNGPLTAPADAPGAHNGVYAYSFSPAFPTETYQKENYFVDVVFNTVIGAGERLPVTSGMVDQDLATGNQAMNASGSAKGFRLYQNTPNPANGWTKIRYTLPAKSKVTISLLDMQGRLVRLLVDEVKEKGDRVIELDTRTLGKGVYLYRMQADGNVITKRLVVE